MSDSLQPHGLQAPLSFTVSWSLLTFIPEYSLEGLMLKLKLQYFGHLIQRANSLEKTLMWGKLKAKREGQDEMAGRHHQLNGHVVIVQSLSHV